MWMKAIERCRICGSDQFRELFDLGQLAYSAWRVSAPRRGRSAGGAAQFDPMRRVRPGPARLHDFSGEDLFRSTYGYRSGLNESMVRHLGQVVAAAQRRVALRAGDVVLDIGSNDGTLLSSYDVADIVRIGIDPTIARFQKYYPPGILTLDAFFTGKHFRHLCASGQARIVTSISMFYDLPAPNDFVRDVGGILADDGIWILELSYRSYVWTVIRSIRSVMNIWNIILLNKLSTSLNVTACACSM